MNDLDKLAFKLQLLYDHQEVSLTDLMWDEYIDRHEPPEVTEVHDSGTVGSSGPWVKFVVDKMYQQSDMYVWYDEHRAEPVDEDYILVRCSAPDGWKERLQKEMGFT